MVTDAEHIIWSGGFSVQGQIHFSSQWDTVGIFIIMIPVDVVIPVLRLSGSLNHSHERSRWAMTFNVSELRSITVKKEGWTFLIFRLKESSTSLPPLHFHQGGSAEFLDSLRRFALLSE